MPSRPTVLSGNILEMDQGNLNATPDNISTSRAEGQYSWLTEPIAAELVTLRKSRFFDWINNLDRPQTFACAARQTFFNSVNMPRALGLMLSQTTPNRGELFRVFAAQALEEADHHTFLFEWMTEVDPMG